MRLRNIHKIVAAALPLCVLGGMSSCSDTWDDHYDKVGDTPTVTLLDRIQEQPKLSDVTKLNNKDIDETIKFLEALDWTWVFWIFWIVLIGFCVYDFYYFDNRWLE